jgi:ACR3 family arsenite transporter
MMYPILCKVQYESLHKVFSKKELWKQIGFSVFINWIIAPFLMVSPSPSALTLIQRPILIMYQLALSWAFLPDKSALRSGLILVGLGRCIAMVCYSSLLLTEAPPSRILTRI